MQDVGMRHISFKPGSKESILAVCAIAAAMPNMPVILQWTGGRAGGHHSFEDMHQPIIATYAQIREHDNIILVAGSGMGSASTAYPYLTGEWALRLVSSTIIAFEYVGLTFLVVGMDQRVCHLTEFCLEVV